MRWIVLLIGAIWNISRNSYVDVGGGLRPGSGSSTLFIFLYLMFFLIGLVLYALGFDLDQVDIWIEAQSGRIDFAGKIGMKGILALFLALCSYIFIGGLFQIGAKIYARMGGVSGRNPAMEARRTFERRYQGITRAGSYNQEEMPPSGPPPQEEASATYWGFLVFGALIFGYAAFVNLFSPL